MNISNYVKVKNVEEAYNLLLEDKDNIIVGGGAWLRLTNKKVKNLIDLEDCNLKQIKEDENTLTIGAMNSLRDLESNESLQTLNGGILSNAIKGIMGVSIRNIATIGGSIIGKYSFSDILTPLLVMDCSLEFYKAGKISLEEFMKLKSIDDILLNIIIKKSKNKGYFTSMKKTSLDFAVVNVAITSGTEISIAVGARPSVAALQTEAMEFINNNEINEETINKTASMISQNTKFGSNAKASESYRRSIVETYIKRGLKEVTS